MKIMIKSSSVIVFLIMVVSCATTPHTIPEKYNLDNELEEVDRIYAPSISSWKKVDNQSVILRANVTDYYLLVLSRPMYTMVTDLSIRVSSTSSNITPGFDRVFVGNPAGIDDYIIEKIYKIEGNEQAREIRERLRES
jgi:hypothetical protein